ncbi:MAG: MFS transporter [Alphaproteobacteria bacterium]|nr:MFS transporter [Alphaproteobacteria bacterium]
MSTQGFRLLSHSNLTAQSAEQIALAAIPMVAVVALGAGVAETGLLATLQTLPFLILALPAGLLADRLPRRQVMAGAELLRAAALAVVPMCILFGGLSVPLLAAIAFVAATGTVAFSVAAPSLVPALVPRDGLAAANGRLELVRSLAFAAGPALAGALLAWTNAGVAFALAACLSVAAAALLAQVAEPTRIPGPRCAMLNELREGAAFALGNPLLRPILLTAVGWNVSWFILQAVYVPYALDILGLTVTGVGITLAAYGVGMVSGAVAAPAIVRALPFGWSVAFGPIVSMAAAGAMALSIWWPNPVLPALAFFLFGAGPIVWTICQTTLRQAITPERMLGRVSALVLMATAGARPIGAVVGGLVGAAYGPADCIALAALGFVMQAIIIIASPVRRLVDLRQAQPA